MALIALATVSADNGAVAVIFALGGVALVIIGVLLPRIQGLLKFGPTGFELTLAELGERTRGFPVGAKAEVLDELVEATAEMASSVPSSPGSVASRIAAAGQRAFKLEQAFAAWLAADGWDVQTKIAPNRELGLAEIDVLARRDGVALVGEVKSAAPSPRQIIDQLERLRVRLRPQLVEEQVRYALAVPASANQALADLAAESNIELYVATDESFEHFVRRA